MTKYQEDVPIHLPSGSRVACEAFFDGVLTQPPNVGRERLPRPSRSPKIAAQHRKMCQTAEASRIQRTEAHKREMELWQHTPPLQEERIVEGLNVAIDKGYLQENRTGRRCTVSALQVAQRDPKDQLMQLIMLLIWIVNHRVTHNVQGNTAWGRKVSLYDLSQCGFSAAIIATMNFKWLVTYHPNPPRGEAPYVHLTPAGVQSFLRWCSELT